MAKPSNDRIERHYFEKFRKIYPLPDGYIAYGDKPDVIVRGSRKLGIEITNFYVLSGNLLKSEQRQAPRGGLPLALVTDGCLRPGRDGPVTSPRSSSPVSGSS